MTDSAAHNLLNLTLDNGWYVTKKIEKTDNQTGAFFSVCYLVERNSETCFLKAFDIMKERNFPENKMKIVRCFFAFPRIKNFINHQEPHFIG